MSEQYKHLRGRVATLAGYNSWVGAFHAWSKKVLKHGTEDEIGLLSEVTLAIIRFGLRRKFITLEQLKSTARLAASVLMSLPDKDLLAIMPPNERDELFRIAEYLILGDGHEE